MLLKIKQTPCYSSYLPSGLLLSSSLKALSSTYVLVFVHFPPSTVHKGKAATMKRVYGFKDPFILFYFFFFKYIQLSCQENLGFHCVERRLAHTRALFIQKESNQITEKYFFLWMLPVPVLFRTPKTDMLQQRCVSGHAAFGLSSASPP